MTARERILAAARDRVERGERPAVAEITARAGVSRATFYRAFGSREELFRELEVDPPSDSRREILEAAAELIARDGLARLSMDELAVRAGVSRARLYRLYPGKSALFAELVRVFSPIEALVANMERLADQPPEKALPELAVSVWRTVSSRIGIIRPLLFEVASLGPDVRQGVLGEFFPKVFGTLGGYLVGQMAAGRLRQMHPILAIQSFVGPIIVHVLLRPVVTEGLGMELDSEAAVREFATNWVRGMTPDPPGDVP
jgi:AcrR family transcriptional regulator